MIIDAHCHLYGKGWSPQWFRDMLDHNLAGRYGYTPAQNAELREKSFDPTGDTAVKSMDGAGVDKAVSCIVDHGLVKEEPPTPIHEVNRLAGEMCRRHPGRLYFACGVDPRRDRSLNILEQAVKEFGAISLKLHPADGWWPNDTAYYPLYKKCIELNIPVDFHTGPFYAPLKSKYCMPLLFDDIAADLPDLKIQCTHAGDFFYMEMIGIAKVRKNIYVDLATWQRWANSSHSTLLEFYSILRKMIDFLGPRVMFASDWSGFPDYTPYKKWVKTFTEIPDWVKEAGIEFSKQEIDDFLGGTAFKLLGLKK